MTDISENTINETIESDADFFMRFLNSNMINPPPANNVNSSNNEVDSSGNTDIRNAINNLINELNELDNNLIIRRPRRQTRLGRRNEMSRINPLFNHPIPELNPMPPIDNEYDFISSLFRLPVPMNYNRMNRIRRPYNLTRIIEQSLMDPEQDMYKHVLSEDGEEEIKSVVFKKNEFPNESCPMTLNDFKEGDTLSQLPCGHVFEPDAIMKWLKNENASCPICRKPLKSKEVKKNLKMPVLDSSANNVNVRRRAPSNRDLLLNLMETRMQQEEEDELQAAIMESLRLYNETNESNETNETTDNSDHPKND